MSSLPQPLGQPWVILLTHYRSVITLNVKIQPHQDEKIFNQHILAVRTPFDGSHVSRRLR